MSWSIAAARTLRRSCSGISKADRHTVSDLICAKGMFHSSMVCAGEDKVCQSQLVHPMEALHLRPLEQVQVDAAQLHAAVYAVMDDLVIWHGRKIKIGLYIGFEKHIPGLRPRGERV